MVQENIGKWAFILGVAVAIIAGLASSMVVAFAPWILLLLVALGLVVGFLNISAKEVNDFLLASIALILVGTIVQLTSIPQIGAMLQLMVEYIAAFVAPAALVVSLKAVYNLASKPAAV